MSGFPFTPRGAGNTWALLEVLCDTHSGLRGRLKPIIPTPLSCKVNFKDTNNSLARHLGAQKQLAGLKPKTRGEGEEKVLRELTFTSS